MTKIILSLAVLLIAISSFAAEIVEQPKERMDPNVFSIMPWGGGIGEGPSATYENYFQEIYDCGFNVAGFMPPSKVALAGKYNIKTSVEDNSFFDKSIEDDTLRAEDWANKMKAAIGEENLKYVYQVYVKDEPWVEHIPWVKIQSQAVKKIINARPYVNLNPNYASKEVIGDSYVDYCDQIIKGCGLDYVSYDNYSLFVDKGLDEDRFYSNIEGIREAAIKNNIIFVNIILSIAHFNYAEPDDYSINVQGWSTLAYGGRGLSYFLFTSPQLGNYRSCAYDKFGSRTPLWYTIRNMNYSIHNLMPYYKDLESVNVFHCGYVPKECKGKESAKLVNADTLNIGFGMPYSIDRTPKYVIGEFKGKKDGKDYAIIVNKDPKYSLCIGTFEFKNSKELTRIKDCCTGSPEQAFKGEDRWIAPGHGILLRGD